MKNETINYIKCEWLYDNVRDALFNQISKSLEKEIHKTTSEQIQAQIPKYKY